MEVLEKAGSDETDFKDEWTDWILRSEHISWDILVKWENGPIKGFSRAGNSCGFYFKSCFDQIRQTPLEYHTYLNVVNQTWNV